MKLTFDGDRPEYHPATGLDFVPGEHDYPDEHAAALLVTGRFKAPKGKAKKAEEKE